MCTHSLCFLIICQLPPQILIYLYVVFFFILLLSMWNDRFMLVNTIGIMSFRYKTGEGNSKRITFSFFTACIQKCIETSSINKVENYYVIPNINDGFWRRKKCETVDVFFKLSCCFASFSLKWAILPWIYIFF